MKKSNIGFPYPVLSSDNDDYINSSFVLDGISEPSAERGVLSIELRYTLNSPGLQDMIDNGQAQVVVYSESSNSSFRRINVFSSSNNEIKLSYDVALLSQTLRLKGMIIAKEQYNKFRFEEHNKELFGNFCFTVNKGDILAFSNMFDLDLGSVDPLANKPSVFSIRPDDNAKESIRVDYQGEKIDIWLRRDLYDQYQDLREEPALKTILASYFVMPAIVEVLSFMKNGVSADDEDIKRQPWFISIEARLRNVGIESLDEEVSMTTAANKILTGIVDETMKGMKYLKENVLTGGEG